MHKGLIGKSEGGGSVNDKTLGDYIARKQQQDAFDTVAKEKKLKFHEWYPLNKHLLAFDHDQALIVWVAAQENK
jgi:hypothetical protein